MLRLTAHYEGKVQGVGFRITARMLAQRLGVVGSVSNLCDGRVKLVAEGTYEQLDQLLSNIRAEFNREIAQVEIDLQPASGTFDSFTIS